MKLEELQKSLVEYLQDMQDYRVVSLWNEYCEENRYYDDRVYPMSCFDDLVGDNLSPSEVVNLLVGDFDLHDDWVQETIYGYESMISPDEVIDYDALAEYLIDKGIFDGLEDEEIVDKFDELGE